MLDVIQDALLKHPKLSTEILDLQEYYDSEIEAGEAEDNEYALLCNELEELIDENA